jgi:hypothetical protein
MVAENGDGNRVEKLLRTVLLDSSEPTDVKLLERACADMRTFARLWTNGRPLHPSEIEVATTGTRHQSVAAVRLDDLVVSLDVHSQDGRTLCVRRRRGVRYRLVLPRIAHPDTDRTAPDVELNALLRFWARVPDIAAWWNPNDESDVHAGRLRRTRSRLAAAASSSDAWDGGPIRTLIRLPSPWTGAEASCHGGMGMTGVWRDDVLERAARHPTIGVCTAIDVMYRLESTTLPKGSASTQVPRLIMGPVERLEDMKGSDAVSTLRLLSELELPVAMPGETLFTRSHDGMDARFRPPSVLPSWEDG